MSCWLISTGAVDEITGCVGDITCYVGKILCAVGEITCAIGEVTGAVGEITRAVGEITGVFMIWWASAEESTQRGLLEVSFPPRLSNLSLVYSHAVFVAFIQRN